MSNIWYARLKVLRPFMYIFVSYFCYFFVREGMDSAVVIFLVTVAGGDPPLVAEHHFYYYVHSSCCTLRIESVKIFPIKYLVLFCTCRSSTF